MNYSNYQPARRIMQKKKKKLERIGFIKYTARVRQAVLGQF